MFNALKYTKVLEEVGLTREQAEAHVQMVIDIMDSNFATKADFNEIKSEFQTSKAEIKSEFAVLGAQISSLRSEMTQMETRLENRLVVKLGALIVVVMTLGFAFLNLSLKLH